MNHDIKWKTIKLSEIYSGNIVSMISILFNYEDVSLVDQNMVYLGERLGALEIVYYAVVGCLIYFDKISLVDCAVHVLFFCTLLTFCLIVLTVAKSGMSISPTIIMGSFSSLSFSFMYFVLRLSCLLNRYLGLSSWWIYHLII